MSWYRNTEISRVFYTALGHAAGNFTSDPLFRTHIKDALLWLLQGASFLPEKYNEDPAMYYDRQLAAVIIQGGMRTAGTRAALMDMQGRIVRTERLDTGSTMIGTERLAPGIYMVHMNDRWAGRVVVW
jgi:hypothetical protein